MKPKSIMFAGMTMHEANNRLLFQLYQVYDNQEAANIADLVMENITGWKRIDRVLHKDVKFSRQMEYLLEKFMNDLANHTPVQYVLNEAWFAGMKFIVNENVLIPRPETEELTQWVISESGSYQNKNIKILDIGTGSGCIPVVLKKQLPRSSVFAIDISALALDVAKQNALIHSTEISFIQFDILNSEQWKDFPRFDLIISNPPYIPMEQIKEMKRNVLQHEPHLALFVKGDDPLIFYKAIAGFAKEKLLPGGNIFVEINEDLADQTAEVFFLKGFNDVQIKKDMQGKDRMIRAAAKVTQ